MQQLCLGAAHSGICLQNFMIEISILGATILPPSSIQLPSHRSFPSICVTSTDNRRYPQSRTQLYQNLSSTSFAMDHTRDPCPWVIFNDFGGAFSMGAIGGAVWHGVKGFRNSPMGERRIGAITAIKARAPVLGGNFGVWGGLFGTFDCAVKGIRKKEDPYNAIIAGFFTGGALAIRGGYKSARNSAIGCAILLAVIEGVGIGLGRLLTPPPLPQQMEQQGSLA
ncbi:hypothetical protein AOL_s00210g333 [Orbilia oligospora ATCC 24927]|uniref:Translocase of the inner membrane n=4 Tax=Orbiliaceae TaxID=47021 RepID=G1XSH4_ARTOA|nr:hypothetical protein AOL_s00210g333 [Orbilia oligospora ATCC 24927]EGX43886.1 hypothetical protein AOL_s00210g333 [Orbilia oligospora ATCC 24927]